jgi:hypothetical protein
MHVNSLYNNLPENWGNNNFSLHSHETAYSHKQCSLHDITPHKPVIFKVTAVSISNPIFSVCCEKIYCSVIELIL